jgi:adenosine deaminase
VQTYDLHYLDLKNMVRTAIEHAFLPGPSLWAAPDKFSQTVSACRNDQLGAKELSDPCASFLEHSEKAHQQWELEQRFHTWESSL